MRSYILISVFTCITGLVIAQKSKMYNFQEAKKAPETVINLKVACEELKDFGETQLPLINVKSLYLDGCSLSQLPQSVLRMQQLNLLNISNNQLTTLPDDLAEFTELRVLNLRGNQLKELPNAIRKLPKLREIDLAGNMELDINQALDVLGSVEQLDFLYLSDLGLSILPDKMTVLSALEELHLSGNSTLNPETTFSVLSSMASLKILALKSCDLTDLSGIDQMDQLIGLVLDENAGLNIDGLSDGVKEMDNLKVLLLRNNQLRGLPKELSAFSNLDVMDLSNNSFPDKEELRIKAALPNVNVVF